jgi:hypothetical protein
MRFNPIISQKRGVCMDGKKIGLYLGGAIGLFIAGFLVCSTMQSGRISSYQRQVEALNRDLQSTRSDQCEVEDRATGLQIRLNRIE